MDIFNTVVSAIDLTERVWKAIDDFQKVPERMRRLQVEVKSLSDLMHKLKGIQYRNQEQEILIINEINEIEKTLKILQNKIGRHKQKPSSSVLGKSFGRFKTQLKFDDMDEMSEELQKRKASLNLTINMLVLNTVGKVDKKLDQQQEATIKVGGVTEKPTVDPRQTTKKDTPHITRKEFLEHLNAPNYAEDEVRVKAPAEGTAKWIYEREEYRKWEEGSNSSSLHLVGKMGSGKSVLTKSIVKNLKSKQAETIDGRTAVLYYFCSCVNRTDSPENILKGFISQFTLDNEQVYERTAGTNELLQSRRSGDNTGWSFEALWHIFSKMVQLSGLQTLYCVVDALDECANKCLDELLSLLHKLSEDKIAPDTTIKLLFSSREYTHILDSMDSCGSGLRLFIDPELVSSDIRVAMQGDIKNIQRRLKLEDDEVGTLQESILEKSDGMFLWVSLAAKDIMDNAYDATFETLEELIEDLPSGLKGLYEKNWDKLVESLPNAKIALANKVLTWVLLANRPLTISELTIALAIEPGQKNIPPPKKLLRNLSAFVLNYLAPFIEITSSTPEVDTPNGPEPTGNDPLATPPPPAFKPADASSIRLVHQSAQEYLLEACKISKSRLEINLREGHEAIARTCLTYMSCEELQLGWIDPIENGEGMYVTTNEIRSKVESRLNKFQFLGYASVNWGYHVRKCQFLPKDIEEKEEDDVFQVAINFVENLPKGHACAAQSRQLLNHWEGESHFSPAPPLHHFSGKDMLTVVKRLLRTPEKYVKSRDLENCTALHYPAQGDLPKENPGEREEIVRLLLNAGVDPNEKNILGDTPLSDAAGFQLAGVVKTLLERGVLVNEKNKQGKTALNENFALGSKEIVEGLLAHGADIETVDEEGFTPILRAAGSDHWETVKLLVSRKCNVNAKCDRGWACLHYAAEKGDIDMVQFLFQNGADVHTRTRTGLTPLHSAVRFDKEEVFDLLIKFGADIDVQDYDGRTLLHSAAEGASFEFFKKIFASVNDVNARCLNDWTPLGFAAKRDHVEITKFLVENGANIRATETAGFTPLHLAVEASSTKVARYLLDIWENVNMPTASGLTALGLACSRSRPSIEPELITWLLDKGADPNVGMEDNGMTPFHVACCEGILIAVEILFERGADIEKPAKMGIRPLCFACKEGRLDIAKFLHSKGALIDCGWSKGGRDFTPLELTCFNGHLDEVKWLIEQGADASQVSLSPILRDNKMRPVHKEVFRYLMEHGGDINYADPDGDSPLLTALTIGNTDYAKLILSFKPDMAGVDLWGNSVFHLAVYEDDVELWDLLAASVDVSQWSMKLNENTHTPAQKATLFGRFPTMKILAKICPKESFRVTSTKDLWKILASSEVKEKLDMLKEMNVLDVKLSGLDIIADVDYDHYNAWFNYNFEDSIGPLNTLGFNWNARDIIGRSPIHAATARMMADVFKSMLEQNLKGNAVRLDTRDYNFMSIFDLAIFITSGQMVPRPAGKRELFPQFDYLPPPFGSRSWSPPPLREPIRRPLHPPKPLLPSTFKKPPLPLPNAKSEDLPSSSQEKVNEQNAIVSENIIAPLPSSVTNTPILDTEPRSTEIKNSSETALPSPKHPNSDLKPQGLEAPLSAPSPPPQTVRPGEALSFLEGKDISPSASLKQEEIQVTGFSPAPLASLPLPVYVPVALHVDFIVETMLISPAGDLMIDDMGATILHAAAREGVKEVIEAILKKDRGKEAALKKDENGWLPSMIAETYGWTRCASLLLEVEKTFNDGETLINRTTTKPKKLSVRFKGSDLLLSDENMSVTMDDVDCGIRRDLSPEGYKIQLANKGNSVMANAPMPYRAEDFYFEVEFLEDPRCTGGAAIGLAALTQNLDFHLPGWTRDPYYSRTKSSWGYHAVNGFRTPGNPAYSEPYGSEWVRGDRVGCGYNVDGGKLWFTRNGTYQGIAFVGVKGVLYPIVGLAGGGMKLKVDFEARPPPLEDRIEPLKPLAEYTPRPRLPPPSLPSFHDQQFQPGAKPWDMGNPIRDREVVVLEDHDGEFVD